MKTRTFFYFILIIIVSIMCFIPFICSAQQLGDVNNDTVINIVDALMVAQYYVDLNPAGFYPDAADTSGDGSVNIVDALLIAQYYVGLISEFPGQTQTPDPTQTPTPTQTPDPTQTPTQTGIPVSPSEYDNYVLADDPVTYWTLAPGANQDISGNNINGSFTGNPSSSTFPNGDAVSVFNGIDQYFEIPDNSLLEITRTGILTIEAWMRPDVLNFQIATGTGPYVHWMGKGEPDAHSWAARIYNYDSYRPNRISGYSFNLSGGLGAGSYFQDVLTAGQWIHYTLIINSHTGLTKIFKNGILRDTDYLSDYSIVPGDGTAPVRIGTRSLESFFEGAIGKVALYDYELTEKQLLVHYNVMRGYPLDRVAGEDFDSFTSGSQPLNFTLDTTANTSVLVSNGTSVSPPNSMHIVDNDTGGYARAVKYFSESANPVVEMKIKSPGEKVDISILESTYVARLYFREDGTFAYYYNSYVVVADYNTSDWNAVKIIFHGSSQTYDVELNSILVAADIPYYSSAQVVDTIRINTGSAETASGVYVDDIYVSE